MSWMLPVLVAPLVLPIATDTCALVAPWFTSFTPPISNSSGDSSERDVQSRIVPLYAMLNEIPASGSALAPAMSARPGAEPMSIASVSVTWRPVGPVFVIVPHDAENGYVTGGAVHVTTMFTVRPAVVRPL